ncbi:hypothetical protein [Paenibacillus sp. UNC499MF]|uniref:hypothetical protein n=1 Tax=Paenibacillus sp. UNC499MF TaxID=1502751 RepID=UPI00089FEA5B|nr:hypothetical protein [Paenibacillus sp. UNC499MF]SEG78735.1 hypothetical protein SAMN02799616_05132 [Paenibacillus sp. UNC499MF]
MVQPIDTVRVKDLTILGDPRLVNYGQMRDCCENFSYEFRSGHVYGIIGECGSGGWVLSYYLTGREKEQSGTLFLNNVLAADSSVLAGYGCYVGEGVISRNLFGGRTVRQQIEEGLKQNNAFTLNELVEWFELSSSRLDRKLEHISNERWNASIAIGLAHGKTIFCFPWLNTAWIQSLRSRIAASVRILKDQGAIIIIPTAKREALNQLADYCVDIFLAEEKLN